MIRYIILDKIKRVLFDRTFHLGLLKILLQFFFMWKSSVTDHLLVSFFEVKSLAIKNIHTRFYLNLLLAITYMENGMKKLH